MEHRTRSQTSRMPRLSPHREKMHITPCRIAEQDKESHCPSVGRIRRARAACNFGPPAPLASARDESVKTLKTRTERLNKRFTKHFNKRIVFFPGHAKNARNLNLEPPAAMSKPRPRKTRARLLGAHRVLPTCASQ